LKKTKQINNDSKKVQVKAMFNSIAHRYDFLNHFLSLGIDHYWRKKAINMLKNDQPKTILDLACGTADLSIASLKLKPEQVTGIDISENMVELGKKKIRKINAEDIIDLGVGDSEELPFEENSFDAIIVAFGVRNFENLQKGLMEAHRVLKNGGRMVILEFSNPETFPVKQIYQVYFSSILPVIGRLFSKNQSAYSYLPNSVKKFPQGKQFAEQLKFTGFRNVASKKLTLGICSIYTGIK
jgi:demethylmenaquinone methyltransferase / 2-methoxy-6-polyprenyl-1,4-benzoquinol methylase